MHNDQRCRPAGRTELIDLPVSNYESLVRKEEEELYSQRRHDASAEKVSRSSADGDSPVLLPGPPPLPFGVIREARLLLGIAIPTVAVQTSAYFLYPQAASIIGRTLGTRELAGMSLGSLTGNLTCLSVVMGALTASQTLQPRAYGAGDYAEVGRLTVRGFVTCALILLPISTVLTLGLEGILTGLGQDPQTALLASRWVRIYLLGVPSVLFFRVAQRFLACQNVVWPVAAGGCLGCFVVQPLLLRILVPERGFLGSAAAVVLSQTVQASSVLLLLRFARPHLSETWPGMTRRFWAESLRLGPMLRYARLSAGGVLSFSEWWFWETMCFVAGSLGVVPLCVHTIAYQIVPLLYMLPLGISIGMSVRIGQVIAEDVATAKMIAIWTLGLTAVLAILMAAIMYSFQRPIVAFFTSDDEVIRGCEQIWPHACILIIALSIFGTNAGIMRALGLQWRQATVVIFCAWVLTVPTILYLSVYRGGGLELMWKILPCTYLLMDIILVFVIMTEDWQAIGKAARERRISNIAPILVSDEKSDLLNSE